MPTNQLNGHFVNYLCQVSVGSLLGSSPSHSRGHNFKPILIKGSIQVWVLFLKGKSKHLAQ